MKRKSLCAMFLLGIFTGLSYAADLVVYTYDSFNSKWGPGPVVFQIFEKQCKCTLKVVTPGDAGAVLNRLILEKSSGKADVVLGLNNSQLGKAFQHNLFEPYRPSKTDQITKRLWKDPQDRVIPFDYGYLAFIYDSQKIKNPPKSLDGLLDPRFKNKIVIENPQTSSPGLSFLHWTIARYSEEQYLNYWKKLQKNLLTITSGWSSAYGMFTKGETPIVLSYITSPAYHLEYEKTERYKAMIFEGGHYQQTEYAGIIKGTTHKRVAKEFSDFVLSPQFQNEIPLTNWMYPAIEYQPLPKSFRVAPKPLKMKELDADLVEKKNRSWLKKWVRTLGG